MRNPSNIGRIFYGIAIAVLGFQTIYYNDFPYMLIPSRHAWIRDLVILAYVFGTILVLTGASILFEKKIRQVSLLLGGLLLLIFCFYFIPYQFMAASRYMHFGPWENAEKELTLAAGAFVIAGSYPATNENPLFRFLGKLISLGPILFAITMILYGVGHFLYAKEVADYIPSWVPSHLFWAYFAGVALIGSGVAIILKIKVRLMATLLGTMIFLWFIMLHIPRVISSPPADLGGEVTSACLALAYSGIAFVIAGTTKGRRLTTVGKPLNS